LCILLSEWVIFQLYHGKNKIIFNEMMMKSSLYKTNTLSWIFIVLAHWNNSLQIDMLSHSDTLSWFRANQSLLFLAFFCVLSREATNTNFIVFGLVRSVVLLHKPKKPITTSSVRCSDGYPGCAGFTNLFIISVRIFLSH